MRLTQYSIGAIIKSLGSNTSEFKAVLGDFTWPAAEKDAETRGGHLATITSADKWEQIVSQLGSLSTKNLWIGGYQEEGAPEPGGGWKWVTGEPFSYSNWGPGSPDNNDDINQRYIEVNWSGLGGWPPDPFGTWNDVAFNGAWNRPVPYAVPNSTLGYILEIPSQSVKNADLSAMELSLQRIASCLAGCGAESVACHLLDQSLNEGSIAMESSKSKITDVDVAKEVVELARTNILAESASSMLAQANNVHKEVVLKLLTA